MKSIDRRFVLLIFLAIFLFGYKAKLYAQFDQCQNSTTTYVAPCYDTTYNPVCGCDQKTYQNYCEFSQAQINSFTPRTCEEITIPHIYPNPASTWLNYRIYLKQTEDAFVYIYDEYGRPKYYRYFENVEDSSPTIDVSTMPTGAYVLIAVANGHFASKKFIKY